MATSKKTTCRMIKMKASQIRVSRRRPLSQLNQSMKLRERRKKRKRIKLIKYLKAMLLLNKKKRKTLRMRSTENKTCLMMPVKIRYRPSKIHNQRTTKIWLLMNKCLLRKRKKLRKRTPNLCNRTIPTEILMIHMYNLKHKT